MQVINWSKFLAPYEYAVDELCLKFRNWQKGFIAQGQHSPIEAVEGRVKRIASILEKINRKNIDYNEIQKRVEDIAGVRILCSFVEDIYTLAEMLHKRSGSDLTITDERDYITNTKPSGYRSYHILVRYPVITIDGPIDIPAEIQIRTLSMNFWATIEHSLKYKYNGHLPEELQKRLRSAAEASFQLDKEMSTIRGEIVEAQKVVHQRNRLVEQILKNIEKLYFAVKLDRANELNRQFFEIFEHGTIDELYDFNQQLTAMTKIYKVQYS